MGVSSRGGLVGFLARLGRPPVADSDADLLSRFVRTADAEAFTEIVHRHGPMVLSVCRRRLGQDADAEDAFQAVFLVLARSAGSIGRGESLPAWLYRVAYLVSLKAAGRRARHPAVALPAAEVPMPDPPIPACETEDLRATLDAELAGLPEKFRSVAVLCLIEGRTSAEAAAVLGVPVGTVDSRLHTARKRLQARLTRRGVAVGTGLTFGVLLGELRAATGPEFRELALRTVSAVLAETAAAGAVSPAVADLAHGVTLMTTTKLRLWVALVAALGVLGGASVYLTAADRGAKSATQSPDMVQTQTLSKRAADQEQTQAQPTAGDKDPLQKRFSGAAPAEGIRLDELFEVIEKETDLVIRVDVAAFQRLGLVGLAGESPTADEFLKQIYQTRAVLPRRTDKMAIRDVLTDALAQVPSGHPCTYQIRGSQIIIVPAYSPSVRPGVNPLSPGEDDVPLHTPRVVFEQVYGPVVSVSADRKPLAEILADLRKQTGANIVLDPRCEALDKKVLTVTLNDVRLYDALRVIADMAELKMVYAGNIYYVTTPENAKTFQPPVRQPSPPEEPSKP